MKIIKFVMIQKLIPYLEKYSFKFVINEDEIKIFLSMFCYLLITEKNGKLNFQKRINFGFRFLSLEINYFIYALLLIISFEYLTKQTLTIVSGIILSIFILQHNQLTQLKHQVIRWLDKD
jgi:hypothetical protein